MGAHSICKNETVYQEMGGADLRVEKMEISTKSGSYTSHTVSVKGGQPGAVCIAVDSGRLLLGVHWRATTGRDEWEFPRGMGEPGESRRETARRELLEETGFEAQSAKELGNIHADTGILRNEIAVVELSVSKDKRRRPSDEELSEIHWLRPQEIDEKIESGAIGDGITLAAYLLWKLSR